MAYIPESHKKYNLLPMFVETDREVIIYPSRAEGEIDLLLLPYDEFIAPYGDGDEFHGYKSYSEYYAKLDDFIIRFGTTEGELNDLGKLIVDFKKDVQRINVKENWSVLRCIGVDTINMAELIPGNYYYMACSVKPLKCEGIINDEGFPVFAGDFYDHPKSTFWETERDNWEIIEDPTGIARLLLNKEKKGASSTGGLRFVVGTQHFEALKSLVVDYFDVDEDDIDLNTTLRDLGIDTDEFIDFLVANKEKIENDYGYILLDNDRGTNGRKLYLEIHEGRSFSYLSDNIWERRV